MAQDVDDLPDLNPARLNPARLNPARLNPARVLGVMKPDPLQQGVLTGQVPMEGFEEARDRDVAAMYARMDAERAAREAAAVHTLGCDNNQCRVVEYAPHSSKTQDQKCPACYGQPAKESS